MAKTYTKQDCLKEIAAVYESGSLNTLYQKRFIQWNGTTSDTDEEYQEIFAKYIYDRLIDGRLPLISVCNIQEYCKIPRNINKEGTNPEEKTQREYYGPNKTRKLDEKFGEPIWIELQAISQSVGKGIDLVYYNEKTSEINIFELKYHNKGETLLRAVLEIQTYYQKVDWYKALIGLKKHNEIETNYISKINKYVMFDKECKWIYHKYESLTDDSYVKKILDELKIGVVVI